MKIGKRFEPSADLGFLKEAYSHAMLKNVHCLRVIQVYCLKAFFFLARNLSLVEYCNIRAAINLTNQINITNHPP